MKLKKVISGGQDGADVTGLACAKELGLKTGGWMPLGCKTDSGPNRERLLRYRMWEHPSSNYPPRTEANVRDSDCTLWFGNVTSPGGKCTQKACERLNKYLWINPVLSDMRFICETYETINIAGNRDRTNPGVNKLVYNAFQVIKECMEKV